MAAVVFSYFCLVHLQRKIDLKERNQVGDAFGFSQCWIWEVSASWNVWIGMFPDVRCNLHFAKKLPWLIQENISPVFSLAGLHPLHWDDHLWHFDEFGILMVRYLSFHALQVRKHIWVSRVGTTKNGCMSMLNIPKHPFFVNHFCAGESSV